MDVQRQYDTRNYGVDIVKITAMFLVVLYHVIGCGIGFPWNSDDCTSKNLIFSILESFSLNCIDLFALATGYLYSKKQMIKKSKIISLWIQVLFWSVVPVFFLALYQKDMIVLAEIPKDFFVISFNRYWYFCAYLILFFMMPFLNRLICNLQSKQLLAIILIFGILFSLDSFFGQDAFAMSKGNSFMWLAYMYIVGSAIRKWEFLGKIKKPILIGLAALAILFEGILLFLRKRYPLYSGVGGYNYFLTFIPAILLFISMTKIKLKHNESKKFIKTLSNASFAVYLSHLNPLIYQTFIQNKFRFIGEYSLFKAVFATFGIALIIYSIGMILGILQVNLFELLKVYNFCEWLEIKIKKAYNILYEKICLKIYYKLGG